jgi:acetyl esterase/lipase
MGAVAGCANGQGGDGVGAAERFRYGEDTSQWADLYRPDGDPHGVVVVIHGGFWKAAYEADLGAPLAEDLARRGWAAWNLEYRRVGNGGGYPATLDDVAAGIDALADVPGLDLGTVVALGHSAGGHLATWAAGRAGTRRWSDPRVPVSAVVSQAGVLDLGSAARRHLGSDAVAALLGRPWRAVSDEERHEVDPLSQVPLDVPVWCVHGRADDTVPLSQSETYVTAAREAGARADLVAVEGDHFVVIDLGSDAWARTVDVLERL